MRVSVTIPSVAFLTLFVGCTLFLPKETRYLQAATDHATSAEVKQELGAPMLTSAAATGERIWVYQARQEDPGYGWTSKGLWCDEYVLTFDRADVLRRWVHKSYLHGGERMPTYCVPGGFQAKS
jgi:hypothetical protein